uniref:Uncharacterized protein n=1 Tax=Pediculus humanus subsp. corporis TaxID=121224 RepID=A0A2Y9D429_PEDHC
MCKKKKKQSLNKLFNKYGPIVNLQGPLSGNIILLHKPEHLSAVFEQDSLPFIRSVLDSLELSRQEAEEKISIALPTDWNTPEWNHLRKLTADSMILEYDKFFEFVDLAGDSLISVIKHCKNGQNTVSDDFMEEIKRWSLDGLSRVLFTKSLSLSESKNWNSNTLYEPDKLFNAVQEASNYLTKCEKGFQPWRIMVTPSLVGLGQAYRTLSTILSKQLYQAEMSLKHKNDVLIKSGGQTSNSNNNNNSELTLIENMLLFDGMTSEEITCNLIDILILGSGVASSALGFLLYHLAQNVKAQQKLSKEGKEILPEKTTKLNIQKLHSMKYMQACIKESMRLNTPYPLFFRLLQNDIFISNYIVPKGTYVVMDSRVFGMREQFFEEPDKFIPERWLNDDKWMQNAHAFSSFPLCHGPKSDLIKRIIEMQLCACVAKIIRNFEIEYHFGEIVGTENFISFPEKPLKLNFIDRND